MPSTVRQLSNDVEADRDYNTGVKNVESQSAHAVSAKASVLLGGNEGEIWDCIQTARRPTGTCATASGATGRRTSDGHAKSHRGCATQRPRLLKRPLPPRCCAATQASGGGKRRKLKAEEKEKAKGKRKADRALARPLDRARDVREAKAAAAAAAAAKKGT